MAQGKFVAYYRVSTERQGRSGLGLEAQRAAVHDFLNGGDWKLVAEVTEIESGKKNHRPELARAIEACRAHRATLVIAKLDRLSRDAHFLLGLERERVEFVAADMPQANRLTIGIMAVVADEERRMISARTKAALAAAKARGQKLGGNRGTTVSDDARLKSANTRAKKADDFAHDLSGIIREVRSGGAKSLRQIATELNARGIETRRGGTWSATQVSHLLKRLEPDPRIES